MATTSVEVKQAKLAENAEAAERWERKLFRAVNELRRLRDQRKRLLKPKIPTPEEARRERKRENDRQRRLRKKEHAHVSDVTNLTRSEVGI
jgi:hypothetical protein